jgi:hypothetical protein
MRPLTDGPILVGTPLKFLHKVVASVWMLIIGESSCQICSTVITGIGAVLFHHLVVIPHN